MLLKKHVVRSQFDIYFLLRFGKKKKTGGGKSDGVHVF